MLNQQGIILLNQQDIISLKSLNQQNINFHDNKCTLSVGPVLIVNYYFDDL